MITFKFSLICKHFQNLQGSFHSKGRWQMVESEWTKWLYLCDLLLLGSQNFGFLKEEEETL